MGFGRRKGFVERPRFVRIEIVYDHANDVGVGIALIDQPLHLVRKVYHRALWGHSDMPPPGLRLTEEKDIASSVAFVLIVVASGLSRLHGQRLPRLADQ